MRKHFVITTCGTSGDIFPFIKMGQYLLGKNHKVSFITSPYFEDLIKDSGLAFIPFGTIEQMLDLLNDPGVWHPKKGFTAFWMKILQPNLHRIRLYVQSLDSKEEVVVLSHPALMALADLARADHKSLKIVLFYLYPTIIRSYFGKVALGGPMTLPKATPKFLRKLLYFAVDRMFLDVGIVPDLNKNRINLGLAPIDHFFPHLQSAADLYVTLFPEWYASTKPDYPKPLINGDFVFYNSPKDVLSDELKKFLDVGQAPLLFTAGTGNLHAGKLFEMAADVVVKMKARAVFLSRFREQLPAHLPDSILWQEYAPFNKILPEVSIIVHHGGMGTLAEASKAGIPQLIVPFGYDQFDNALTINDLGIGKSVPLQLLTRKKLFSKLSEIQRSKVIRENCLNVSSNFLPALEISQILDKVVSAI